MHTCQVGSQPMGKYAEALFTTNGTRYHTL